MEALVQEFYANTNGFMLNRHSKPANPKLNGKKRRDLDSFQDFPAAGGGEEEDEDYSDAVLKYINQMLMEEEDLENRPCMLHDCIALQATEKYFSDVLHGSDHADLSSSNASPDPTDYGASSDCLFSTPDSQSGSVSPGSDGDFPAPNLLLPHSNAVNLELEDRSPPKGKRNYYSNKEDESAEKQRNKQLATSTHETEPPLEKFNEVLLCNIQEPRKKSDDEFKGGAAAPRRRKKRESHKEVVDLRGLLTQCAQAIANYDGRAVNELLAKIRHHSSPRGNGMERLAFYLANALEARLNGAGTAIFTVQFSNNISAANILKAYHMYIKASPFKKISNIYANHYIMEMAAGKHALHVIDFGVLYGFQWPCMIQSLANRPGGPPKLRITGIDLPQPGFKPAERVEATGARLKKFCEQFNVPFEFKAIAKRWETITLEDLEIDRDEILAVNCLYRLENVPDETVVPDSPRDAVLGLIHKIRPDIFIHGVGNGAYNSPFFTTRFREAVFHFSTLFDMFEATVAPEDEDRRLFEETVLGRNALNVIACEGTARVERPETYKQWKGRNKRAGFRQVPLDQELVMLVKDKARSDYHKDFSVDGDGKWLLQGWKGRVVYALSCWKPAME
nr:scarecrow-like protein 11 [Ipomoea trifida]